MVFAKLNLETKKAGKSDDVKPFTSDDFKSAKRTRIYFAKFEINTLEEIEAGIIHVTGTNVVADQRESFYAELGDFEQLLANKTQVITENISQNLPNNQQDFGMTFDQSRVLTGAPIQNPDGSWRAPGFE